MAVTLRELLVKVDVDSRGLKKGFDQGEKQVNKFSNTIKSAGKLLLTYFAADRILSFGRAIVKTTGQFQTFEAVLANTLGSRSGANKAINEISTFAAKTPFAVDELTNSFVKLANQGFVPTTNELRKLGDLASSTGKGFDQLTEAIIDAQVGQFERLKEFGIRASKQGDQVQFTFKGVKQTVDFTNDSIRDYVLSLGDLEGVSGSMAAISETVTGKLSNMGDNITQLEKNIGDSSSGLIAGILDLTNNALGGLNAQLKESNDLSKRFAEQGLGGFGIFDTASDRIDKIKQLAQAEKITSNVVSDTVANIMNGVTGEWSIDSFDKLEDRVTSINERLQKYSQSKYFEQIKEALLPTLKQLTDEINKQDEASQKAQKAAKAKYESEIALAKELWTIEQDARKSEKQEEFIMPNLDAPLVDIGTLNEQLKKRLIDNESTLNVEKFNDELLKIAATYQGIVDRNYQADINEGIEKANNLLKDQEERFKHIQDVTSFWGSTLTGIFEAMLTDGANAVEILTDAIKKMAARLAAAAVAAGLVSLFLGGSTGGALKALGGFKGLFASFAGIPAFAEGGLVSGPTLGLVGEGSGTSRSNPEVIAPLNDLKNMMGFGNMQLVARVSGNDLLFLIERAQRTQ